YLLIIVWYLYKRATSALEAAPSIYRIIQYYNLFHVMLRQLYAKNTPLLRQNCAKIKNTSKRVL
ncbi:hypothetical protein, partial [Bacillus pumilus]